MYSHERSLVQRFQGRPFALLGVDTDESREALKTALTENNLTWRSWWDGPPGGPICTAWKIRQFPTIFLIDAKGIIRYRDLRGAQLEAALEKLIKEAESKAIS